MKFAKYMPVFLLCAALLFTSCTAGGTQTSVSGSPVESTAPSEPSAQPAAIDLTDYAGLYEQYDIALIGGSAILAATWANPEEIPADRLATFYQYYVYAHPEESKFIEMEVAAKDLESLVQRFFDVSAEHIQQGPYYNKEKDAYVFEDGIGGAGLIKVVDAKQNGNQFTFTFNVYGPADNAPLVWGGVLTLETTQDGGFKYTSCKQYYVNEAYGEIPGDKLSDEELRALTIYLVGQGEQVMMAHVGKFAMVNEVAEIDENGVQWRAIYNYNSLEDFKTKTLKVFSMALCEKVIFPISLNPEKPMVREIDGVLCGFEANSDIPFTLDTDTINIISKAPDKIVITVNHRDIGQGADIPPLTEFTIIHENGRWVLDSSVIG